MSFTNFQGTDNFHVIQTVPKHKKKVLRETTQSLYEVSKSSNIAYENRARKRLANLMYEFRCKILWQIQILVYCMHYYGQKGPRYCLKNCRKMCMIFSNFVFVYPCKFVNCIPIARRLLKKLLIGSYLQAVEWNIGWNRWEYSLATLYFVFCLNFFSFYP